MTRGVSFTGLTLELLLAYHKTREPDRVVAGIFGQEDRNALVVCAFLPCLIETINRLAPGFPAHAQPLGGQWVYPHISYGED